MVVRCVLFLFFFKQKTAYEVRNCDWSSDVCSSDLGTWVGRGCDVVSPSETVVISPLMGEIVWECDCECGNFA